jgi:hypothetical protein
MALAVQAWRRARLLRRRPMDHVVVHKSRGINKMATTSVFAKKSETANGPARSPIIRQASMPALLRACVAALPLCALGTAAAAQVPGMPEDAGERVWYTTFMTRFNARVLPSFRVDSDLESRLSRAWDAMVERMIAGGKGREPSPLEQYPLLGFVDDRFVVMRATTSRGKATFVVRGEELRDVPTLSSTLDSYLRDAIYPSLRAIAEEERQKIAQHPDYQPRLGQLSAQNPYQHGLAIRVPDMGPFKNRRIVFSGPGGRLSAVETAEYEASKWSAGGRQVTGVMRPQRWGVAVEELELVQRGAVVCRYQLVREVAAVTDTFVGEGRRGVLVRQPTLGAVLAVRGCVAGCDQPAAWTRIHPERDDAPGPSRQRGRSRVPLAVDAAQRSPAGPVRLAMPPP